MLAENVQPTQFKRRARIATYLAFGLAALQGLAAKPLVLLAENYQVPVFLVGIPIYAALVSAGVALYYRRWADIQATDAISLETANIARAPARPDGTTILSGSRLAAPPSPSRQSTFHSVVARRRTLRLLFQVFRIAALTVLVVWLVIVALAYSSFFKVSISLPLPTLVDEVFLAILSPPVIIALCASCLLIPLGVSILYQRSGLRILLLRPFGEAEMTAALKRVVLRHLQNYGHVFTLADRHYRRSTAFHLLEVPMRYLHHLVAPLVRPSIQLAVIESEADLRQFARTLSNHSSLAFWNFMSGGQAFNVSATDNLWKDCVDMLLNSSDVVVMDVSKVGEGSAWEIERLGSRGMNAQCFWIVQTDRADTALSARLGANPHRFRADGSFEDAEAAKTELETHVKRALANG